MPFVSYCRRYSGHNSDHQLASRLAVRLCPLSLTPGKGQIDENGWRSSELLLCFRVLEVVSKDTLYRKKEPDEINDVLFFLEVASKDATD